MKTPEQYKQLPPRQKLLALAQALDDSASRCDNMLLKGTWVEDTFIGTAQRLRELCKELPK